MAKAKRSSSKRDALSKKKVEETKKEEESEDLNYAKAADAFAEDDDGDNGSADEGAAKPQEDEDADSDDSNEKDSSDQESEDDDDDEDDEDDVQALFKGSTGNDKAGDDNDDDSREDGVSDDHPASKPAIMSTSSGPEQCNFDLRNMTAINTYQVPSSSLHRSKPDENNNAIAIPLEGGHECLQVNEDFLLDRASAGCAQLIAAIWQLPTEMGDAGALVSLPVYDEIPIPRSMPPPPPKAETKWEKFAKAKGIPLNKEKRSRKVWDEATGSWMYRHGYEKANSSAKEWPIMEVGANDDPFDDPWEKLRDAKRARTEKNLENRLKNQERVGNLGKGTTNRVLKSREKSLKAGKAAGNADRNNVPPTGVPVDLKTESGDAKLRGKASTSAALEAVQRSTASLGKFDKMREGEPERKKTLSKLKKRKFESATDKKVITTEGQKSMKILDAVINGGGVAKEKAIRKGQYAKGETAYDYEYNDGLGASSFRKKKGRAGAGKMKKMTKKRSK